MERKQLIISTSAGDGKTEVLENSRKNLRIVINNWVLGDLIRGIGAPNGVKPEDFILSGEYVNKVPNRVYNEVYSVILDAIQRLYAGERYRKIVLMIDDEYELIEDDDDENILIWHISPRLFGDMIDILRRSELCIGDVLTATAADFVAANSKNKYAYNVTLGSPQISTLLVLLDAMTKSRSEVLLECWIADCEARIANHNAETAGLKVLIARCNKELSILQSVPQSLQS